MGSLNKDQIKEVSAFFTTTAVAWFTAGVIGPLFTAPGSSEVFLLSIVFGLSTALIFLVFSVIIIRDNN